MDEAVPLYERDPEAWRKHLAEGNARQPRKRVSADVILRDEAGRLLLVDPQYKPDWDTPGGMVEANEPPHLGAERELREELGLEVRATKLLVVDWRPPSGPWDDLLAFIFDAGVIASGVVHQLRPHDAELTSFEFCTPKQARQRLRPYMWRRVSAALEALDSGAPKYLTNGTAL